MNNINLNKKQKSIVIFTEYYIPHLGGMENYVYNIAIRLQQKGYTITIFTSKYTPELEKEEIINGIRIIRYPVYKLTSSRYPIPKKNKEFYSAIHQLDKINIDYIILNTRFFLSTHIGSMYSKKNNIPNFLIEHGCEHLTVNNKLLDYIGSLYEHVLTQSISKKIDKFYGVSEACNDWLEHFKLSSSGVLNGGVNLFEVNDYEIDKEKEKIIFTYAGRLLKQKGVLEAVNAFEILSKKYKNIQFHIAGKGPLLEKLDIYARTNSNIKLLGHLSHKQLMEQLAMTNIFIYAPVWPEGLGISVIEAGLMDCAVIISNQKGILEVVPNENYGLIVKCEKDMLLHMEKLIIDENKRKIISENLKKRIIERFGWEHTVEKIISIVE